MFARRVAIHYLHKMKNSKTNRLYTTLQVTTCRTTILETMLKLIIYTKTKTTWDQNKFVTLNTIEVRERSRIAN